MAGEPLPQARSEDLVIQDIGDEVLVYDLTRHKAHCLNRTAALVWRKCDGTRTPLYRPPRGGGAWLSRGRGHSLVCPRSARQVPFASSPRGASCHVGGDVAPRFHAQGRYRHSRSRTCNCLPQRAHTGIRGKLRPPGRPVYHQRAVLSPCYLLRGYLHLAPAINRILIVVPRVPAPDSL